MDEGGQLNFFYEEEEFQFKDEDLLRTCTECNETKLLEDFTYHHTMYQKRRNTCKACTTESMQTTKFLRKRNRYPDKNYECPICGVTKFGIPRRNGTSWVVDHCHKTKQFRGWLCENCNSGIGKLKDDVNTVRNALKYLEDFHAKENN